MKHVIAGGLAFTVLLAGAISGFAAETLENELIRVEFDKHGLVSLHDKALNKTLEFESDFFSFIIEHNLIDSANLEAREHTRDGNTLRYTFREGSIDMEAVYELKPGWRFVTKRLLFTSKKDDVYTVAHVNVFHGRLKTPVKEVYVAD